MKKTESTNYAIKSKLLAAVVMLLVATIMVVSSTYAWFTLSTAPEITGISTAVGANGALEMLLATKDAQGEWVYGTGSVNNKTVIERNTYWGNLVNLDDPSYGSQAIKLYPSVLNLNDGRLDLNAPLQMPVFGADGRVEDLTSGGSFAKYNGANFIEDSGFGFRGLGVASGLTERQQAFRTAISSMSTAAYNAQNEARKSLSENGTPLANIAILKAMNSADSKVYTKENVNAIGSMIAGIETALKQAEEAYVQAIIAYSLGNKLNHATDLEALSLAANIKNVQNAELDARLDAIFALLETASIDTAAIQNVLTGYERYQSAVTDVKEAKTAFEAIAEADEYSWNDIRAALTELVNVEGIKINGIDANKVTEDANKNQIASDIMGGKGVQVVIPTGGGVYADIADLCGDYTVDIEIMSDSLNVGVDGLTIKATMSADSTNAKPYLTQVSETINAPANQPAGDTAGDLPLTELYGYVIDLAFRTNAAQSNLLLQTDAKDRIYSDKTDNSETMGSGSTMTFKSSSSDFTTQNVKDLMSNLRVVFYSTEGENNMAEIYATAKLDVVNGVIEDAAGVTAKLYIYKTATATKVTMSNDADPDAQPQTLYLVDGKYYNSTICTPNAEVSDFTGKTLTETTETEQVEVRDDVITSLDQNQEKHISVLVYLDGTNIENSDVAANVATSMTGSMNLQFASSATLVPMEYGDLHD